jgi:pyruvate/2-oxoglutarate/acetoin dehydrogenase E1 component
MTYADRVTQAMGMLSQHPKTLFVGQAVRFDGQLLHKTLRDVPLEKRVEMPVIEDFQMGFCTGLALEGYIPISIYPRWDFLILAANQLVNHLDKIPVMSDFRPKVIIRTAVGDTTPLNPGPQHTQNHTAAFRRILKTVHIIEIESAEDVLHAYKRALSLPQSVIVVEKMESYR